MKKIIALLLAALMCLCLTACGEETPDNQVWDLLNNGYVATLTARHDNVLNVMLENSETASYMTLTATLSDAQKEEFEEIDIFEDDYDAKINSFLGNLRDFTLEDVSDVVPTQEELDSYIGMTVAEVEDEGFQRMGYSWSDNDWMLIYDNGKVELSFNLEDGSTVEDPDTAEPEVLGALVISGASFDCISGCFFD